MHTQYSVADVIAAIEMTSHGPTSSKIGNQGIDNAGTRMNQKIETH